MSLLWKFLVIIASAIPLVAHAEKVALLIGVGKYQVYEGKVGHENGNLEGPLPDVEAMQAALVKHWDFKAERIRTLVDNAATRNAILRELNGLLSRSQPNDEILIFYSGHGTSALDSSSVVALAHGTGAVVPTDWAGPQATPERQLESLIIGRRDLRPIIDKLEAGNRQVTVIIDACYSGQAVRSIGQSASALPSRFIGTVNEKLMADLNKAGRAASRPALDPYPYTRTVFLAASAEGEQARDIPSAFLDSFPTVDRRPHGAMTDAILRVIMGQLPADFDRDGRIGMRELHRAVSHFMDGRSYSHSPQVLPSLLEDKHALGQRALFGMKRDGSGPSLVDSSVEPLRVVRREVPEPVMAAVRGAPGVMWATSGETKPAHLQLVGKGAQVLLNTAAGDLIKAFSANEPQALGNVLTQQAWAHRIRQLAERNQRAMLPFEYEPAAFGGNFPLGSSLDFVLMPDRAASLLILNIDADGKISVLYPTRSGELAPVPAKKSVRVEGTTVSEPLGTDIQLAFAFDQPAGLEKLMGAVRVSASDKRVEMLEQMLQQQRGKFTFARSELRTLPRE